MRIKKTMAAAAFALSFPGGAFADPVIDGAARALEMWAPLEIKRDGTVLMVRAKERRITRPIYLAMMKAGLCAFNGAGRISLAGIREIVIVNRFVGQGWVFEGGQAECKEISNSKDRKRGEILLLERTRML